MSQVKPALALDVGEKRIGAAYFDGEVQIPQILPAILVDGKELIVIEDLIKRFSIAQLVVGYPRNQSGEPTAQSLRIESFRLNLEGTISIPIYFQDESLTSVLAEQNLKLLGKSYSKADVDSEAASLILKDYLGLTYGRL